MTDFFLTQCSLCMLQIFTRFGKVLKIVTFTKNSKYLLLICMSSLCYDLESMCHGENERGRGTFASCTNPALVGRQATRHFSTSVCSKCVLACRSRYAHLASLAHFRNRAECSWRGIFPKSTSERNHYRGARTHENRRRRSLNRESPTNDVRFPSAV